MTTRPDHHEPLDAGERDLAALLGRAGPVGGPSPALDARILAAAHATAATHKPRRHGRLAWLGIPPAMVTGVGVAAAAVLALGLVWQLRPQYSRTATESAAAADSGEELIIMAEPAAPRAQAANPPPLPEDALADDALPDAARTPAAPPAARAEPEARAMAKAAREASESARADAEARQAAQAAVAAAPAPETDAAAGNAAADSGFVAEPAAAATQSAARRDRATYTSAARATAKHRREAARAMAPPPAPATAPAPAAQAPAVAVEAEQEAISLDRIEVSGSRIRADWSQVAVNDDTHLPAAEWLERIRARRDNDDADGARTSLRLFRREYPRVRIPDDLRPLLAEPPR